MFNINAHNHWVNTVEFSPDTRLICSGSEDRFIKLWDVTNKEMISSYEDHNKAVKSVRFHPDGTCIASASADHSIRLWDVRSKKGL